MPTSKDKFWEYLGGSSDSSQNSQQQPQQPAMAQQTMQQQQTGSNKFWSFLKSGQPTTEQKQRYVSSGLEHLSQDAYMKAIQGYLDGTDTSAAAVDYRQRLNASNQKRKQNYDDAVQNVRRIEHQMRITSNRDDQERLKQELEAANVAVAKLKKYGDDKAEYDVNNYRRSGQQAIDQYSGISKQRGFSEARSRVTGGENYNAAEDDLGRYFENQSYVTALPDIDAGDYSYAQYENQDKKNGDRRHWDLLTDDEINTYYTLMESSGKTAASQYLDDMQIVLDRRNTEANTFSKEDVEALSVGNRIGMSGVSTFASVVGGLPAFLDDAINTAMGREINPYNDAHLAQNYASSVRGSTAEIINEATGAKDTDFMTWGDAYQALMSATDSALGGAFGGNVYGALMGMGAASSTAKDLWDQGATNGQIAATALAAGAAEGIFEKYSIETLLEHVAKYGAASGKQFLLNLLLQSASEGSEELFTDLANTITESLFAYDFSNWAKDKEAYLKDHPGATDSEIISAAIFATGRRALQSAAAGALSGALMGAAGTTTGYVNNRAAGNYLINQDRAANIVSGAADALAAYKKGNAGQRLDAAFTSGDVKAMQAKIDNGTLSSKDAGTIGKLYNVFSEYMAEGDKGKISEAVESRLGEIGYTGDAASLAELITKKASGEHVTAKENATLKNNREAQQILKEITGSTRANTAYERSQSEFKTADKVSDLMGAFMDAAQNDVTGEADFQKAAERFAQADSSRTEAKEKMDAAKKNLNEGESSWVGRIGTTVIDPQTFSNNSLEGYAQNFGRHEKLFKTAYMEGQNVQDYAAGFNAAYQMGKQGGNLEAIKNSSMVQNLSEVQVTAAYQAGQDAKRAANERNGINNEGTVHLRQSGFWQDGQNPGESAQGVESNAEQNQERNAESGGETAAAAEAGPAEIRTGKVIKTQEELGIDHAKPGVKLTQVGSDFSEETKKAAAMAKQVGAKVIFFTGGYLQFDNGRLARGMKQGDTIYLRADDPNFSASAIAGHESTHVLLDSGRLDRAAVLDALKGKYSTAELNAFAADYFGTDATIDELIDEIICDAMGGMNAFAKSKGKAAFLQEVQGLAEKAIRDTGNGAVDSSQKLSAVENDLKEGAKPVDPGEIITDGVYVISGDSKYSMVSMQSDIAEGTMFRDLLSHGIMTESDITKLKSDLEGLLEYMRPNRNILDMNETYGREGRRFSPYKPNSDPLYKISMDFSTLCSKRLLTQYVIEQLQLRENRPMTAKEQMAIRAMLNDYRQQEKGLQVACAMCYVEAARLKSPGQMEKWMSDPTSGMKDFFSKKNAEFNKRVKDAQSEFKVNHGYEADTPKKKMKASDVTQLNKIGPKMRAEYQMSSEEAAIAERAAQLPRSTYLTAANLANLRDAEPEIYSAYTTFIRNATRSKALETDEPYYYGDSTRDNGNGVVVTDSFIEAVNRENGMRFSSWSDWRIQHMLDYITAVIDNSVRGAAMHGYTKFTQEVRVLGKTGMMFNLSGVAGTQTGLNPDGSLSFSETESIAVDLTRKSNNDALAMRDMFPETAGLQCIGVSDEHIHALLASDIIDYVIPYHTSGLNAALRRMAGINGWKDYTAVQNAKVDSSIKGDSSIPGWHVEPVFSEFFVGYNTGMTGIEAMRKSAENYINMCRERGMTPKFEAFTGDENYWKLLIDRKMINQKTGELIQQKPVKPIFDFAEVRKVVDETVANYDSGMESRALAHIVDNWDSVGDKIKELEKAKKTSKKTKAVKNIDNLANEMLAAQQKEGREQKFSIVTVGRYKYVQADRQVLSGDDPVQWQHQIEDYINDTIRGGEDVVLPTSDGHSILITARSSYKLSDRHVSSKSKNRGILSDESYAQKGRIVTHIDELIKVAKYDDYENDVDGHHENDIGEDGFNYYNSYFMDADGKYYLIPVTVAVNDDEETVYSIGRPQRRRAPTVPGSSAENSGALHGGSSSSNRLAYTTEKSQEVSSAIKAAYEKALASKQDFSTVNSEGTELSPGQIEFFKDSKIRDDRGNLIVVHHGTEHGDFTVFDAERSSELFFFADANIAKSYVNLQYVDDSTRIFDVYLNAKNPLIIDADGYLATQIPTDVFPKDNGRKRFHHIDDIAYFAKDNGYDGLVVKNVKDYGLYTEESLGASDVEDLEPGNVYVVFNPNQIKNVDNTNPTSSPDIRYSTVNSTQLALENPDLYDEIQTTYEDILAKTKGKDLAAALQAEAQKHQADLQMWEHEATVLERLWKQSEKNVDRMEQALAERRERIAEVNDQLRERRRDVRTIEREFMRVVREWEKQHGKLESKTEEAASLKQALAESLKGHRQDNATWEREYDRLEKMYERADRKIDRLEQDIAHRKEMAEKKVEGRKRTAIRNKILDLNHDFQRILDHPGKGDTAHAPRSLIKPLAEFCSMFANAEWGYRGEQLDKAIANGNSQVRIDQISRAQALMAQISKRYEDLAKESGVQGASYQQGTADQIKQATDIMAEMFNYKSIHDMTSDELEVIYKAMKSIMHSIKTANQMTAMETTRTLVETVNRLNRNIDEAIPASRWPKRFVQRYVMWQMSPSQFFQYICGYAKDNVGIDIDRMFKRGTERMLGVQRDFDNHFNPLMNSAEYEAEIKRMTSTKEKDLVTVGLKDRSGNDVKMTRGMRLSVYMLLNQEDSLRSLAYGGFALPRIDEYYHGNISAAYGGADVDSLYTTAQGETISEAVHTLQELKRELKATEDAAERAYLQQSIDAAEERLNALAAGEETRLNMMREAIWADLSDYEKQLVEAANEWMEHSGNLMQEVYYELNGFDPARVKNYWTIHRDPTTIQSLDTTAVINEVNLSNAGFTKERVKASNPILLTDFFQELLSNKQKMSRYYGFATAQRDFNKMYMFKAPGSSVSVKKRIEAKFQSGTYKIGVSAEQYIDNYLKSVSGANKGDNSWLSGLYSMAAGATLSANPRVAISQLASLPTAAAVVGWKNALNGVGMGFTQAFSKQAKEQLANDSVWYYQRYKGEGSTREVADMRNSGSVVSRAMNSKYGKMMFNWCQNMDCLATGPIMWEMARSAVLETGMKETDPGFKEAVQDKYSDIIRFSQPNYTETERSDLLRDKSVGSKILTMYKTQSNQNFNLLIGASMEMRKMKADFKAGTNGVTEADVKAATAKCANAYTAVAIGGTVVFSLLRLAANFAMRAVNPYRDDDTDEVTNEGIFKGFMKDVFSSLSGTVAMGSILYDGVYAIMSGERYYGVSDNAVGMLSDTLTSLVNLGQAVKNGKDVKGKSVKALMNIATAFGIPANNLKKLGTAAYGWANQIFFKGPGVMDADNPTSTQDRTRYVNAVLTDDQEKADNVMAHLISQSDAANEYLQAKEAASGVRSYLKKQFEDQKISEDNVTKVLQQLEYEDDEIKKDIKQWTCFIDTGIKYSDIKEAVMKRVISEDYAVQLYMKYGGLSKDEAKDNVYCHVFDQTYPKLAGLSKSAKLKYRDAAKTSVSAEIFAKAYQACNAMQSDKDSDGKAISGSKKQKIVNYIMSLSGLSNSQRKAIWDAVKGTTSDKGTPWE